MPKSYKAPVFLEQLVAGLSDQGTVSLECKVIVIIITIIIIVIIMFIKWGVGTRCVPTPKMAYFSVFKAFLFLKYFENNLGPIESSFNP